MFSRKKAVEIPPVEEPKARAPPVNRNLLSSSRNPAGPSSSGRPMANDRFGNPDANRQELFKGARPPNRSFVDRDMDGPPGSSGSQLDDEDEEVEAIKQQIKFTKQESLSSTRNALRIAREAEETARNTMNRLGEQSDRLANTENHLDMAKAHAVRADDQQKEIVALNRSIFRPTFTFNKKGKRDAHEQKLLSRHEEEKAEREEVRRQQYESRERTAETLKALDKGANQPKGAPGGLRSRLADKARYQFENTESDDELEDELDDNLNEISGLTSRLNLMSKTMGTEIDSQNRKLEGMSTKTDRLDNRIHGQTERLKRIK
ncbi:Protein transport protein S9 plasma membrane t-SNARE [Puccinia graminis f. sp. tritici]|uniref:Protein transport protein SEC9 n=2 Tax=Puccinia graminis f. sp. tritici TaxID=56615 RepID=E3KQK2_PUCGT|nr:uncharacterized protein PGTG_12959 [Puccinia graminis f. sp. tritici CRL 75-36-700-3]EFP86577.2 hypothetical protein PGTG_12959 [Puccinia graminis f. sp. tritici CRL 75-36-700-3]KAA1111039.1 Protein transport protein S9 plasma membrane t-SNARE [Puccinia graminis f. sp. tritici]